VTDYTSMVVLREEQLAARGIRRTNQARVAQGEWGRLVTGHPVHSDAEHLFWDVAALVLIGWMLDRRNPRALMRGLLAGAAAVNAWLWLGLPQLERHCGLSGVLNTLIVLLVAQLWRETRQPWVVILAVVLLVKPIAELHSGRALLTHTAWPSLPSAHLAGLLAGLCILPLRGPGPG